MSEPMKHEATSYSSISNWQSVEWKPFKAIKIAKSRQQFFLIHRISHIWLVATGTYYADLKMMRKENRFRSNEEIIPENEAYLEAKNIFFLLFHWNEQNRALPSFIS